MSATTSTRTLISRGLERRWVSLQDAANVNSLVDKQIMDAVDAELATKGLTKVNDDAAHLYVANQAAVDHQKEFTSFSSGWGYGAGWYGPGGMTSTTTTGSTLTI
jgi:hypothetical protein